MWRNHFTLLRLTYHTHTHVHIHGSRSKSGPQDDLASRRYGRVRDSRGEGSKRTRRRAHPSLGHLSNPRNHSIDHAGRYRATLNHPATAVQPRQDRDNSPRVSTRGGSSRRGRRQWKRHRRVVRALVDGGYGSLHFSLLLEESS